MTLSAFGAERDFSVCDAELCWEWVHIIWGVPVVLKRGELSDVGSRGEFS